VQRSRILIIGDGGTPTGFGRVTQGIFCNLPRDRYDLHQLAVNYLGDPHNVPWPLYPAPGMSEPLPMGSRA
jgi:hypothetical protein